MDSACVLKTDEVEVYKLFTIYPNPATDVLHVKSKENTSITSLSVYNTLGQLIITVTNPQQTIDVSELLSGNYFIKITSNKGIANARFVKK
ncbi:MAG: hypothetical protein CFE23_05210 [Flavobacterium sp. BFFFF1]|nr:MAG: hypothetical protein CFE23_05210 [Flavobacterium sp. BFFFF1]